MPRIPRDPDPFFKWDPDGVNARARADARAAIHGHDRSRRDADDREGRTRLKRWLLRWAWAISTGVLLLGYALLALILTGHGDLIGV